MIRKLRWMCPSLPGALLVALALSAGVGCSGEPAAEATAADDQPFSPEELAAMRKSVASVDEYRALLKVKLAERAGAAHIKTKSSAGGPKPK